VTGANSGVCGISWSTVKSRHMDWVKGRQVNMPVQFGLQKEADIPDVPAVIDLVKGDEQAKMARLILAGQAMARPYAAPPGIPADRRKALVAAFDATMKDPEFLADAQKMQADVNPVTAAEIEKLLAEIYATPKDIVAKAGGSPRSVGQANGSNPIPVIIPCHRVVAVGHIGGYSGGEGLPTKRWLLALENPNRTLL